MSARTYFINPYTFVPLSKNGPACTADENDEATHALLQEDCFTGKIHCKLRFITPAVIPGEVTKGDKSTSPGLIRAYAHNGYAAIPGSRIRGHLCNLMRAINSSPLAELQKEEHLFRRVNEEVKKGYLIYDSSKDSYMLQEVRDEILVAHPERAGIKNLLRNAEPLTQPLCYTNRGKTTVVTFSFPNFLEFSRLNSGINLNQTIKQREPIDGGFRFNKNTVQDDATIEAIDRAVATGLAEPKTVAVPSACGIPEYTTGNAAAGAVFFKNPGDGRGVRRFKKYMTDPTTSSDTQSVGGIGSRWVAFRNWSGMDGESRNTGTDGTLHAHWNAYHVVDLSRWKNGPPMAVDKKLIADFRAGVQLLAEKQEKNLETSVRKMADLADGTFVYFTVDSNGNIKTIGRHYRYLVYVGGPREKTEEANKTLGVNFMQCPVTGMSGWSDDTSGKKGRLWVEMACGPELEQLIRDHLLVEKDLRILSSQPPKQYRFYLDNGDYNSDASVIRGRKFFWHDPKWEEPMWDNEDSGVGRYSFENPFPQDKNLWEQWSKAEVLMATESEPVEFTFTIRVQNLNPDELYLLLTSLTGFMPKAEGGGLIPEKGKDSWCHKVGHARPYLGSGIISITGIEQLTIDPASWKPQLEPVYVETSPPVRKQEMAPTWISDLTAWQQEKFPHTTPHIKALRRIMRFQGAYENLKPDQESARITYPLGQNVKNIKNTEGLTWRCEAKKQPKTFSWFAQRNVPALPKAESGGSQALKVNLLK